MTRRLAPWILLLLALAGVLGASAADQAPTSAETAQRGDPPRTVADAATPPPPAPAPAPTGAALFPSFVALGIEHIIGGLDHLVFLLGLWLACRSLRELVLVVTSFTIAHSLTLAAAALGWLRLPDPWIEALIAATIAWVGIENLITRGRPRGRIAATFCFGLLHGLGFSNVLREVLADQAGGGIVWPLFGFNCGVEIGQLAATLVAVPILRAAGTRETRRTMIVRLGSWLVALAGLGWLAHRLAGF